MNPGFQKVPDKMQLRILERRENSALKECLRQRARRKKASPETKAEELRLNLAKLEDQSRARSRSSTTKAVRASRTSSIRTSRASRTSAASWKQAQRRSSSSVSTRERGGRDSALRRSRLLCPRLTPFVSFSCRVAGWMGRVARGRSGP